MDKITGFLLVVLLSAKVQPFESSHVRCQPTQYIEFGRVGTLSCLFEIGYFGVFWYNTTDYRNEAPILYFKNSVKSGTGFTSGEYDVLENGSLVIRNVSLNHEHNFTVAYIRFQHEAAVYFNIEVIVTVKPVIPFPIVDCCDNKRQICFQQLQSGSSLKCLIQNARPMILLKWTHRTTDDDIAISSLKVDSYRSGRHTTSILTMDTFNSSSLLDLFVCKAYSPPGILERNESLVLVENSQRSYSPLEEPKLTQVERNSEMELVCTDSDIAFLVWKKVEKSEKLLNKVLLYATFIGGNFSEIEVDDVLVGSKGNLIVPNAQVKHEGVYSCVYGNGVNSSITLHEAVIYVNPIPPHPVVDGCDYQQDCVLQLIPDGTLSCALYGIRPDVNLEWKVLYGKDAIEFKDHRILTRSNGDTFDVTLESTYRVHDASHSRLTVECNVVESKKYSFVLKTKVDVLTPAEFFTASLVTTEAKTPATIHFFWIIILLVPAVLVTGYLCMRRRKKGRGNSDEDTSRRTEPAEEVPMLSANGTDSNDSIDVERKGHIVVKTAPDKEKEKEDQGYSTLSTYSFESNDAADKARKRAIFIGEIQLKYKDLYNAVQPIPYIKDRMYCVDRVFVESGIECLVDSEGPERHKTWEPLTSYHDLFRGPRATSSRRFLEGEPGYGKSTVALQLAYDWCNEVASSPLKDVEILILLRLRQLGDVLSIYKAIKQFILPKDTVLNEHDIDYIIRNSGRVVVIFDGFDEYPDRDIGSDSDIISIIARDMFQEVEVVVITRSSFLPEKYPPETARVRLTGFNENARRYYIRKAVVASNNDDSVIKIEGYLKENPILSDLCQVPLLFVIFAHMAYESEHFRKLNSVTSFFRYMITCFHSHMKNKLKDKNVHRFEIFERDHADLDKVAFEAFSAGNKKIVWKKDELRRQLGQEFYDQYLRIGIFVEEEVIEVVDDPETPITEHAKYKKEVRFYHKIFCEWYAAHYLSDYIRQNPDMDFSEHLQHLDPFDVQYLYRFSCGLNSTSAEKIIKHLNNLEGGDKFAILCILERSEKEDKIKETISQLCLQGVVISNHDSLLLQRSSLQLLEIAATNDITTEVVHLHNCLSSVDLITAEIKIKSGLCFGAKIPVKILMIILTNRKLLNKEAVELLQFAEKCTVLKCLEFHGCVPPRTFLITSTLQILKSRGVQVRWRLFKDAPFYVLNHDSGKWENEETKEVPTPQDFQTMISKRAEKINVKTDEDYKKNVKATRDYLRDRLSKGRQTTD